MYLNLIVVDGFLCCFWMFLGESNGESVEERKSVMNSSSCTDDGPKPKKNGEFDCILLTINCKGMQ